MRFETNFLRQREQRVRLTGIGLSVAVIVLTLLLLANGVVLATFTDRTDKVREGIELLKTQIVTLKNEGVEEHGQAFLAGFRDEVAFANALIHRKSFSWTALLGRIEKAVPRGVAVGRIEPAFSSPVEGKKEADEIGIYGEAASLEALTTFIINLEDSAFFHDVYLMQQSLADRSGKEIIAFDIRLQYLLGGEGR